MSRGRGGGEDSVGLRRGPSFSQTLTGPFQSWMEEQNNLPLGGFRYRNEVPVPPGYVVFDIETTGLDPEAGARIIQLALIELDSEGNQLSEFQTLFNPETSIDPETIEIHGITNEMVADAPVFRDVWPKIKPMFEKRIWTAHNLRFDQNHLIAEAKRVGEEIFPQHGGACTFEASQLNHPTGGNSLSDCMERLGITVDKTNLHDAAYDTWGTVKLVQAMIKDNIAPESVYIDKSRFWRKRSLLQAKPLNEKELKMMRDTLKRKRVDMDWAKRALIVLDSQYKSGSEITGRQKQILDDFFKFVKNNPRYEFLVHRF